MLTWCMISPVAPSALLPPEPSERGAACWPQKLRPSSVALRFYFPGCTHTCRLSQESVVCLLCPHPPAGRQEAGKTACVTAELVQRTVCSMNECMTDSYPDFIGEKPLAPQAFRSCPEHTFSCPVCSPEPQRCCPSRACSWRRTLPRPRAAGIQSSCLGREESTLSWSKGVHAEEPPGLPGPRAGHAQGK